MGKTYKKCPDGHYRNPRGRKQAIINGARYGATPPDAYSDIRADDHCFVPYKVSSKMKKYGVSSEIAAKKMKRKFNLESWKANRVVRQVYENKYW